MKTTSEKEKMTNLLRYFGQMAEMSQRKEKPRGKDIHDQLIDQIKHREFSLQLDEATGGSQDAHLICYVRLLTSLNKY